MATTPSIQFSIAAGGTPGGVVVTVYGGLGVANIARLQCVLDDLLSDGDLVTIALDLHRIGDDTSGISGLGAVAERAQQQGAELTLCQPSEALRQAIESEGLTGLIGVLQRDRRPPWSATATDRGRPNHPSGQFPVVDPTLLGSVDNV